jgi:hypothetical protein
VTSGEILVGGGVDLNPPPRAVGQRAGRRPSTAAEERLRLDNGVRRDQRARGDHRAVTDHRTILNDRAVADQRLDSDGCPVYDAEVGDRCTRADLDEWTGAVDE